MRFNKDLKNDELSIIKESHSLKVLVFLLCISIFSWALITLSFYKAIEQVDIQKQELNKLLGITDDMDENEIIKLKQLCLTDAMKYVILNEQANFQQGKLDGIIELSNMKDSLFSYIITVSLDETGEEIYKSGLIEPGYMIREVKLKNTLNKGKYIATAELKIYFNDSAVLIGTIVRSMVVEVK